MSAAGRRTSSISVLAKALERFSACWWRSTNTPPLLSRTSFTWDQVSLYNQNRWKVMVYFCLYPKYQDFTYKSAWPKRFCIFLQNNLLNYLEPQWKGKILANFYIKLYQAQDIYSFLTAQFPHSRHCSFRHCLNLAFNSVKNICT